MKRLASSRPELFERAYVATGYLLGARGEQLTLGLSEQPRVAGLCNRLGHPEQSERAEALAGELTPLGHLLLRQRIR